MLRCIEEFVTGEEAQKGHDQIQKRVPQGDFVLDKEAGSEFLIRKMIGVWGLALIMFDYRRKQTLQEYLIDVIQFIGV